jgi:hypothetical protein
LRVGQQCDEAAVSELRRSLRRINSSDGRRLGLGTGLEEAEDKRDHRDDENCRHDDRNQHPLKLVPLAGEAEER